MPCRNTIRDQPLWKSRRARITFDSDYDGLPAPPLPPHLRELALEIATAAGMRIEPDLCLINYYGAEGRMGLHQDKDEGAVSIAAGIPVVSLSIGGTARFLFGGLKRRDPIAGRFNLTFRQSDEACRALSS